MTQLYLFLSFVVLIFGLILFLKRKERANFTNKILELTTELSLIKGRADSLREENQKLINEIDNQKNEVLKFAMENSAFREKIRGTEEKLSDLNEIKNRLTKEFENLANKIFQEKMSNFHKESSHNMDLVLRPFKDKLTEFQGTVTRYREDEMRETASLKNELENIFKLNQRLSVEAENLTKALKGDNKFQGDWGEFILKRILENSGLREGEEYVFQGKDLSLKNSEGETLRPDVIINLPDNKHIIVDSKVSLIGYEKTISSETETQKIIAAKDFITSIKNHIKQLSQKKYQALSELISPDFVLLFIPTEGAFACALQSDNDLFQFGWDRKIILVSPTTLMVTLRTIESIWRQEKQTKNAFDIAKLAGELYDKFVGLMDDLANLKGSLDKSQKNLDEVYKKLSEGRGSILTKFEKMKELGAQASKSLS